MAGQLRKFRNFTPPARLTGALLFVLAAAGTAAAHAQPVTDFRLPPATSSPATPAVGPTDSDHPVAGPTAAPSPATTPTVEVPATTATPRAKPQPAPAPAPQRTTPASRAQPEASTPPPAASAPVQNPATTPVPTSSPLVVVTEPSAATPSLAATSPVEASQSASGGIAWWWLIPALLAGAVIGAVVLRRRAPQDPAPAEFLAFAQPAEPDSEPTRQPPPPAPLPAPAPPPPSVETNAAALFDLTLVDIALEPVRLSVSLVNATLQYRLRLDNRSAATVGPIALALDMISAHASLPEDSQLARDGSMIELRHELPALAPGESAEAIGELRLPLAAVTPIRSGNAVLLVPLIRVRMAAGDVALTRAMVVGEPPIQPGGPLRPFRLDQGPRVFTTVIQRPLAA